MASTAMSMRTSSPTFGAYLPALKSERLTVAWAFAPIAGLFQHRVRHRLKRSHRQCHRLSHALQRQIAMDRYVGWSSLKHDPIGLERGGWILSRVEKILPWMCSSRSNRYQPISGIDHDIDLTRLRLLVENNFAGGLVEAAQLRRIAKVAVGKPWIGMGSIQNIGFWRRQRWGSGHRYRGENESG
jgi:hypothetical protein